MALVTEPTSTDFMKWFLVCILALLGFGPGVNAANVREVTGYKNVYRTVYLWKVQVAREAQTASVLMDPHSINSQE